MACSYDVVVTTVFRTLTAVMMLAASSSVPAVLFVISTDLSRLLVVGALTANAVAYGAYLATQARPGRGTAATCTALLAGVIQVVAVFITDAFVLALIAWPCAYILAWSLARRQMITVLGVLGAVVIVDTGYFVAFVFVLGAALGDASYASLVIGTAVIGCVIVFAANGVIRVSEVVSEALRRRRTTPIRPATPRASRDS